MPKDKRSHPSQLGQMDAIAESFFDNAHQIYTLTETNLFQPRHQPRLAYECLVHSKVQIQAFGRIRF